MPDYAKTLPRVLSQKMFPVEMLEDERTLTRGVRKQPRQFSPDKVKGFHLLQHYGTDPLLDTRLTATQQLIWELSVQGYDSISIARLISRPKEFNIVTSADVELALKCVKETIN